MPSNLSPGAVALVGSGEFLPAMDATDRLLLAGRPPVVAVLSTAAAPEGPASVQRWHDLAIRHYTAMGVRTVLVPVVDRQSAQDAENAALIAGAGLVYLSGGNPVFLTESLRATAVWQAIEAAWRTGTSIAGCSAGAMAMGALAFSPRGLGATVTGLGLVGHVAVLPHFDRLARWQPDLFAAAAAHTPEGVGIVGVDEDTAALWRPGGGWTVSGAAGVWVEDDQAAAGRRRFAPGEAIPLAPPV